MTRCKNSGKCNVQPYMRCTACRYDKCVSVGMTKQKSKSRQEKEEDVDDVEILPDSDPHEAKQEEEPLVRTTGKDTDRSQLGAYLKVVPNFSRYLRLPTKFISSPRRTSDYPATGRTTSWTSTTGRGSARVSDNSLGRRSPTDWRKTKTM